MYSNYIFVILELSNKFKIKEKYKMSNIFEKKNQNKRIDKLEKRTYATGECCGRS